MTSIFTKIINYEIPGIFVYEDDICVVIMDKFPKTQGQCLVIPRVEVDYAFDLDEETYAHCLGIAKKVVKAIDQALSPVRTCLVIEGFEVPHAHIKIFPCYEAALELGPGVEASDELLEEIAEDIKGYLVD